MGTSYCYLQGTKTLKDYLRRCLATSAAVQRLVSDTLSDILRRLTLYYLSSGRGSFRFRAHPWRMAVGVVLLVNAVIFAIVRRSNRCLFDTHTPY